MDDIEDRSRYYDRQGNSISIHKWGELLHTPDYKIIKQEDLWWGGWVSTVWLGLDHSFDYTGDPVIFETMVFLEHNRKSLDEIATNRYCNETDALKGHTRLYNRWSGSPYLTNLLKTTGASTRSMYKIFGFIMGGDLTSFLNTLISKETIEFKNNKWFLT